MQFAPRKAGPPSPPAARFLWASVMRAIMRSVISRLSSVSPRPPGMSMTLCAALFSMISSTRGGTCSAPMATMNRSSGSGSARRFGTQRTPLASFSPSRMMTSLSRSKPESMMFSRMIRPKFRRLEETPMMPMDFGCSRLAIFWMGRGAGRSPGVEKRHMPSSGTMR